MYEMGGGNGTLARGVLDFIRDNAPDAYARTSYTIIDVSAKLAARARDTTAAHRGVARVVHADFANWAASNGTEAACFVLGMEVLDNMPHDKLVVTREGELMQAVVMEDAQGVQREALEPLSDPVIARYLTHLGRTLGGPVAAARRLAGRARGDGGSISGGRAAWVPTATMLMLEALVRSLPRARLVLGDFDSLGEDVGDGAAASPAVQSKPVALRQPSDWRWTGWPFGGAHAATRLHGSYLHAAGGLCDVFFPTEFDDLRLVHESIVLAGSFASLATSDTAAASRAAVPTTASFMRRFADVSRTRTLTGFNPLLHDYTNTRLFLS